MGGTDAYEQGAWSSEQQQVGAAGQPHLQLVVNHSTPVQQQLAALHTAQLCRRVQWRYAILSRQE
jgi:hypothetical protein